MTIICGTDLSPNTAVAVDAAAAISKRLKEPVRLVHVVLSARPLPEDDPRRQQLADMAKALRAQGVELQEELLVGQPEEQLTQSAQKAQLLVVGALGHKGPMKGQIGNVAARSAQLSQAPVLVVHKAEPFQEWAEGKRPLQIVIGADASPPALAAARWLSEFQRIGPCEVTAVHLYDPQTELKRLGLPGVVDFVTPHPEAEKILQRELSERCGTLCNGPFTARIEPIRSEISERMISIAHEVKADLIVVGAHQRGKLTQLWYGSTSQAILQGADMAVASVPITYRATQPAKLPRMQKTLVPTDLSGLGSIAIPYAYSLVGEGGTVHIIHIVKAPPDSEVKDKAAIEAKLKTMIPPQAEALGITTHLEIINSVETAEAVCQAAERLGVDAVCMASHGRGGVMQRVMGATAAEVMERSRRPLLVIRP